MSEVVGGGQVAGSGFTPRNRRKLLALPESYTLRSSFRPWSELGRMCFSPTNSVLLRPSATNANVVWLSHFSTKAFGPLLLKAALPLTGWPFTVPEGVAIRMEPWLLANPLTLA